MKVILTDDVKKVGKKHDIIEVKNGFAHNFLIPQKKAIVATPEAEAEIENMRAQANAERTAKKGEFADMFKKVDGQTLTINAKANEQGGLYESIDAIAVCEAINAQFEVSLEGDMIQLEEAIKEAVSEQAIALTFEDITASVNLTIAVEEEA